MTIEQILTATNIHLQSSYPKYFYINDFNPICKKPNGNQENILKNGQEGRVNQLIKTIFEYYNSREQKENSTKSLLKKLGPKFSQIDNNYIEGIITDEQNTEIGIPSELQKVKTEVVCFKEEKSKPYLILGIDTKTEGNGQYVVLLELKQNKQQKIEYALFQIGKPLDNEKCMKNFLAYYEHTNPAICCQIGVLMKKLKDSIDKVHDEPTTH